MVQEMEKAKAFDEVKDGFFENMPVPVTLDCMEATHFSRNPKIVDYLREYGVMKEYGSGVRGMREEMERVGGLAPEYRISGTMLQAKIWKNAVSV